MKKIERIYYRYELWEDYINGMYDLKVKYTVIGIMEKCKDLLSNQKLFYKIGKEVINKWKIAADVNLSNYSRNRQAWIGQAACCYYSKSPEYVTKLAWNELTDKDQKRANKTADSLILEWELNKTYQKKLI